MKNKTFVLDILILSALIVFLFVTAPSPLPLEPEQAKATVPIERVFEMVEAENDWVRDLWTKEIVQAGKKVNLEFDEDWREDDIDAGPLPALFLRETAKNLERHPLRLSLYLGSDFPISASNRFEGIQLQKFEQIKASNQPQFFFAEDTALYTAMFADIAIANACIRCHNDHKESPKSDWKLDDVMGATTWTYPKQKVSLDESIEILRLLRNSFKAAYSAYIEKARTFKNPPEIGAKWPREGYFLPDVDQFIEEAAQRASIDSLQSLLYMSAPVNPNKGLKTPATTTDTSKQDEQ